jgi:protein involved in polysaccharide export with SLBB domain
MSRCRSKFVSPLLGAVIASLLGCSAAQRHAVPVHRLPEWMLAAPRANNEPINLLSLRADPVDTYVLGPRDILGVYIEGILGDAATTPPVHFPSEGNNPPALGYPVPVREDGSLALPLLKEALDVEGMTVAQAEAEIVRTYSQAQLLAERPKVILTMIRKRTNQVLVVREDTGAMNAGGGAILVGPSKRGSVFAVDLPADESDVLHALAESGGLPGLDAKNEVVILRGKFEDAVQRDAVLHQWSGSEYLGPNAWIEQKSNVLRLPLRSGPGMPPPQWSEDDIRLRTGDVVFIETREREVFYTGGLLPGRELPLPRDYDLDVLAAISLAGGSTATGITSSSAGGGMMRGGTGGSSGIIPPTQIIVVRRLANGATVPIRIDLKRAVVNGGDRILIQPGDYILLEYKPAELVANIILGNVSVGYFINGIN